MAPERKCLGCGKAADPHHHYCGDCGKKLPKPSDDEALVCTDCGAPVEEENRYCTNCGEKFEE